VADESTTAEARRPVIQAGSLSRFVMIFLGLLAIFAMFDYSIATAFANIADYVLMPVIGFGGGAPVLTILFAGMLTTTISSIVRDRLTDWVKMARTQKTMSAWRKEQMDAIRKGNSAKLQKLKEAQQGFMKDQMAMVTTPYKMMALTLFLFIVIVAWLRFFVETLLFYQGNQWIAVPWSPSVYLPNFVAIMPGWLLLYSLLAIPFSSIVARVLKYVRFKRRLEEMGVALEAEPEPTA